MICLIRVAVFAILFAYTIECSQMITHPALAAIRGTTFGGLLLGHGFLWSDLACYTVGILTGVWFEILYQKQTKKG